MKIFRGPSTKSLDDPAHELVSEIDLEKAASFIENSIFVISNITKEPTERQAVAHLQLDGADLSALNKRFIAGLLAKSAELDQLKARTAKASSELYALFQMLQDDSYHAEDDFVGRLFHRETQLEKAKEEVGFLAYALDDTVKHLPPA
ncbi:MAG: hypothetical protein EOO15_18555 [Chitinophagaceae bacterium]|nr:MAG: hypothetical protein EOO15_18555 [Chitinophagaceae bacterium]